MAQVELNVKLLAHTQMSSEFISTLWGSDLGSTGFTDGQAVALSAIRTCYSPGKPSEIVANEGSKYFGSQATDGEEGTEADRLFRTVLRSKHTSTVEHLQFVFSVEGLSRAALAQLTRHRHMSYSVQSQRYVKFGSDDRSGGFDYVVPQKVVDGDKRMDYMGFDVSVQGFFEQVMHDIQIAYDMLREAGIPAEDARAVLPQASACNLTLSANLRSLLDFYGKRKAGRGAQNEITVLAEALRSLVVEAEPWTDKFFEEV